MKKLLFLDVEATGVGQVDRLCQVAYSIDGVTKKEYFKPPVPISCEAMAITHITNMMVRDKDPFVGSAMHQWLTEEATKDCILVAHNAQYDLGMLYKEGIEFPEHICTMKIARYLDDGSLSNHQLQYLRYKLVGADINGVTAHDALGDVIVLEAVFHKLLHWLMDEEGYDDENAALHKMMEISVAPSVIPTFRFGKYNGRAVTDVAKDDPGYLQWLLDQKLQKPEGEEDWIYTLQVALNKHE